MNTRDLPRALAGESRRHVRVKENTPLLWHIRENGLVGQGRIHNISNSGMLVELASASALPENNTFSFDSNLNSINYIPEAGNLVWQRKKRFSRDKYLCGFEFGTLPEVLASRLSKRVEEGIQKLVGIWKIKRVITVVLSLLTAALVGYAVWLGGIIFQDISRSNQRLLTTVSQQADLTRKYQGLYVDSTRRLADVTLELNQTTAQYQDAQNQLQAAQQELVMTKSVLSTTEGLLAQVQAKTVPHAVTPVGPAQIVLATYAVHSVEEGKALIVSYRNQIQAVVDQIDQINYEDHLARISALEERDRVRLMYGNQGFFVKSGKAVVVDMRQYQAANFDAIPSGRAPHPDSKVRVNVTVFQ